MNKTYKSTIPIYVISGEEYPKELIFGGTFEESQNQIQNKLIVQNSSTSVIRELDEQEITEIRSEYTQLMEIDKCDIENKISELKTEESALKARMNDATSELAGINAQINDRIRTIKRGTVDELLNPNESICIAVDGKYLHYTWVDDRFVIAKVVDIPSLEQGDIFANQTKNQEVFIEMFGCDFSPSDRFEQVEVGKKGVAQLVGRKLAARAVNNWEEIFIDEDTGENATIYRNEIVVERDRILTQSDLNNLLDHNVKSIVVYKNEPATT